MEIEILTTKKKIGKSIIKQFEPAGMVSMGIFLSTKGECAYYVTDMGPKFSTRVGIFKSSTGEWLRFNAEQWVESTIYNTRAITNDGGKFVDFSSEKEMNDWVETRNEMRKLALKNHLII